MTDKQASNTYYSLKNIAITLLIVISTGWITYRYFTAPPPGYCIANKRVLTDAEYIQFATEGYEKDAKFIDGKPSIHCCTVERQKQDLISKTFRFDDNVTVSWTYEMKDEDTRKVFGSKEKYYLVLRVINSCATVVIHRWGIVTE